MALLYAFDKHGGFLCGDTATGRTAYAYPTSISATKAKSAAPSVALAMMKQANAFPYGEGTLADQFAATDRRHMTELEQLLAKVA